MAATAGTIRIAALMERSGVQFGTSGARGRVADMSDRVCYAYTAAFLRHLEAEGEIRPGTDVALGGDLRPSTERILRAVGRAVGDAGYRPLNCGAVPSPALALHGIHHGIPAVMVTGSHIPADRNGIKYNKPAGEILKADEAAIRAQEVQLPKGLFTAEGAFAAGVDEPLPPVHPGAADLYRRRYLEAFPAGALAGLRLALYEHSAVGRELLFQVLSGLGARVERLAPSDTFVPVDTEAIRPEDVDLARHWAAGGAYDAVVSSDGDSDRPLVSDEAGNWIRGDVAGILTARHLGADTVVTPISCNTAVERCGCFRRVRRTRIGSPYVIEEMQRAVAAGEGTVVGYEANGGFLTASPVALPGGVLDPLPTRDALLVIVSVLLAARASGHPVSRLLAGLPARFTASGRLQEFPARCSAERLAAFTGTDPQVARARFADAFEGRFGVPEALDGTDGVRATFANGEIVHLRASGNAPELRCYTEAATAARAGELNRQCLALLERWRG